MFIKEFIEHNTIELYLEAGISLMFKVSLIVHRFLIRNLCKIIQGIILRIRDLIDV